MADTAGDDAERDSSHHYAEPTPRRRPPEADRHDSHNPKGQGRQPHRRPDDDPSEVQRCCSMNTSKDTARQPGEDHKRGQMAEKKRPRLLGQMELLEPAPPLVMRPNHAEQ